MTGAPTPRSTLTAHSTMSAHCTVCHHRSDVDLDGLVARGLGDTPLLELPLVCRCGARAFGVTVSGSHWRPHA